LIRKHDQIASPPEADRNDRGIASSARGDITLTCARGASAYGGLPSPPPHPPPSRGRKNESKGEGIKGMTLF